MSTVHQQGGKWYVFKLWPLSQLTQGFSTMAQAVGAQEKLNAVQPRGEQMKFNWVSLIGLIAPVVMGIQQIHSTASGATKKQLALESLGLATAAADAVLPPEQQAQANAVSSLIDNFVSLFHATNAPGFGTNSVTAATTPATT